MDIQHATELKYFKVRTGTVPEAEPICKWVCNVYYTETTLRINSSDLLKCYWRKYTFKGKFTVYNLQFLSEHRNGDERNKYKRIMLNICIDLHHRVKEQQ